MPYLEGATSDYIWQEAHINILRKSSWHDFFVEKEVPGKASTVIYYMTAIIKTWTTPKPKHTEVCTGPGLEA
jgi:hypothetical protein